MRKKFFLERIEPAKAREIIFETITSLLSEETVGTEIVEIQSAAGRTLAGSVRAILPVPREYLSAMDGVATKAEFTQGASPSNPVKLRKGNYVEINTGNVVPGEFDCVIRREDYREEEDGIVTIIPYQKYQNVRIPGEDVLPYDLIVEKFKIMDGKAIALALQSGIREVKVLKRIRAIIVPTGSELLRLDQPVESGKIYETNSYIFKNYLEEIGLEVMVHDIIPDEPEKIEESLQDLSKDYHLIFILGGTSSGKCDYTAEILNRRGTLLIHGLNIRPGKPFVFGIFNNKPVFGLPGYPGAGLFGFEYVVLPILKDFLGFMEGGGSITGYSGKKIAASEGEDHLFNVVTSEVNGKYWFYTIKQGSGPLSPFIQRSGYVVIEKGVEGIDENVKKEVYLSTRSELVERSILFAGSHDLSLDTLKEILWEKYRIPVNVVNVGSLGGILAVLNGRAHFAGVHLLDEETGKYNVPFIRKYGLKDFYLFPFLEREQGFILREDFKDVRSFKDIAAMGLTFISRQRGSGTRFLTDYLLKKEGLSPNSIKGYENEVTTHIEVAYYVKENLADVGAAVYPVARLFALKFIPIGVEEYDLLVPVFFTRDPRFEKLIEAIKSEEFSRYMENLGGYRVVFRESPKFEG